MEKIIQIINQSMEAHAFINCVWSNPRNKEVTYVKISAKPIEIKENYMIQFAMLKDNKETHHNLSTDQVTEFITEHCMGYKQIQLFTTSADYQ